MIERHPPGYLLRVDPERIDACRFEQALDASRELEAPERAAALREALDLWRGPPLADLVFEGVAQIEIARLDELRLLTLEARLDAELELGRHELLLAELDSLAAAHPAREHLREQQMLALYRSGRQRDALRVYHETRLELVERYGLEPGEELRALERMILAHDPRLLPPRTATEEPSVHERERNVVALVLELIVDERIDDELARRRLAASLTEIAMIVERHGGVVRRLLAEEVVALFGTPQAHDDDAMRALRAASELRKALAGGVVARIAVERAAEPVEAARRLLSGAGSGDVLLGPAALRLVPGAVDVVPHGTGDCFRVLRFDPTAEPFQRHLDAPLVGRLPQLDQLEAALEATVQSGAPRQVVVLGEAGIGKTRLMREFVARTGATVQVLTGRCASYGDGTDLLPLLDLLEQVGPFETALAGEADAARVIARLREPALTEKHEGFWAFRLLLEAVARDRPLLIVFDDVHWAGPALLDLVEYLVGWGTGPLLILCLARPELLESRPEWREGSIALGPLDDAEALELAGSLAGPRELDPRELASAVQLAEGNPFYLEQLLETGAVGPLGSVPPTIDVLLQSRLGRLPPVERRVLERASVVGREFWRAAVDAASPEDEQEAVGAALMALVRRRLVHPERSPLPGEDGFRFHHGLICDVAYANIAEDVRADLHVSVARSLEARGAEFDELVGYHLEQAALIRSRNGAVDRALEEEAGHRLAEAGIRALKRVDGRAGTELLTRAIVLLPEDESRLELDWALATSIKFAGDAAGGEVLLDEVAGRAAVLGDRHIEARARIEQIWSRLERGDLSVQAALELLGEAQLVFDEVGDELGLGRAWHLTAAVKGVYEYHYGEAAEAALVGSRHYNRAGFVPGASLMLLAVAACRGQTPVLEAIGRCEALLAQAPTPVWESFILPFLAGVEAMDGRFASAREHLDEARIRREEFSDTGTIATSWAALAAEVELLAGDPERAEAILSRSCSTLRDAGGGEWLATNTALLGEVQYRQERFEDARTSSAFALAIAPAGHLTSRSVAQRVNAKALARLDERAEAARLASELLVLLEHTDVLDELAEALLACAEVLALSGAAAEAIQKRGEALAVFEQKGNVASAERVRRSVPMFA